MTTTVGNLIARSRIARTAASSAAAALALATSAKTKADADAAHADATLAHDLLVNGPAIDVSGPSPVIYQANADGSAFVVIPARSSDAPAEDDQPADPAPAPAPADPTPTPAA